MRFSAVLATATALTPAALADFVVIYKNHWWGVDQWQLKFEFTNGQYWFIDGGVRNGCRDNPGPKNLKSLCMDMDRKRGHFIFNGEKRRCLGYNREKWEGNSDGSSLTEYIYTEINCNWSPNILEPGSNGTVGTNETVVARAVKGAEGAAAPVQIRGRARESYEQ